MSMTRVLFRSILLPVLLSSGAIQAANFEVNTFNVDAVDFDLTDDLCDINAAAEGDQCTLRAAVQQANATVGGDEITFAAAAPIVLTIPGVGGDINGDLDITQSLTIRGALDENGNPINTIRNDVPTERIFDINLPFGETFIVESLHLLDTHSGLRGGAIRVQDWSEAIINKSVFSGNSAPSGGGAVAAMGIHTFLTIRNSDFHENESNIEGAAVYGEGLIIIENSSFWNNTNHDLTSRETIHAAGNGGDAGSLIVHNTTISGNSGGIYADNGDATVRFSTIVDNAQYGLRLEKWFGFGFGLDFELSSSIVAGNEVSDCYRQGLFVGTNYDHYNFIGDGQAFNTESSCMYKADTNLYGDPGLSSELTPVDNLPSRVRMPSSMSLALDRIPELAPECTIVGLSLDQRGVQRSIDSDNDGERQCDMGAVELIPGELKPPPSFQVNTYNIDAVDFDITDGRCDINAVVIGDQCTLRAAVMQANATLGPNQIGFRSADPVILSLPPIRNYIDTANNGDLDITESLIIIGIVENGLPLTSISNSAINQRILDIKVPAGESVILEGLHLLDSDSDLYGGAIRVQGNSAVSLVGVELSGNSALSGGGAVAAIGSNTRLTIRDSDLHDNSAEHNGAALYSEGETGIKNSSFWNNINNDAGNREAIRATGAGVFSMRSSTVSNNSAGIRVDKSEAAIIRASTIVDNTQFGLHVAKWFDPILQVHLHGSIVAGNALDCAFYGASMIKNISHNLIGDGGASCAAGTNIVGDPGLAPGLTSVANALSRVRMPLPGSPVIDEVPLFNLACTGITFDQRGIARPIDGDGDGDAQCDIGAVELLPEEATP